MSTWKGFTPEQLERFGARRTLESIDLPYLLRDGSLYRWKSFGNDGSARFLGESKPQIPFGLETLSLGGNVLILTEGESDCLALRVAFPSLPVLGIPGASSWKPEWRRAVDPFRAVYLSFDADDAGRKLTDSVLADLPEARNVLLPNGSDTREVLQRLGRDAYRELLKAAAASEEMKRAMATVAEHSRKRAEMEEALAA